MMELLHHAGECTGVWHCTQTGGEVCWSCTACGATYPQTADVADLAVNENFLGCTLRFLADEGTELLRREKR